MKWVLLLFVCLLPCIPCRAAGGGATHTVTIQNMKFDPPSLKIKPGDTVVWINSDDRDHTVDADDNSFKSGNLSNGDKFEFKFSTAGKFKYGCSYHPRMKATIEVAE